VIGLGVAVLLLLALAIAQWRRSRRLARRLDLMARGEEGTDPGGVSESRADRVAAISGEVDELAVRTAMVERTLRRSFQRFGLVRFNPFEDTGGNQSFALALLDANGDGVIVSSLHSRGGTRVYAKVVAGGRSEAALSDEEARAVTDALGGALSRPPGGA
jgi:hypothetical protein